MNVFVHVEHRFLRIVSIQPGLIQSHCLHSSTHATLHAPYPDENVNADQYGKNSMQSFALARSLQQCEFGFGTTGLALYPDANTLFDVEANNNFVQLLTDSQLRTLFEVRSRSPSREGNWICSQKITRI